MENNEKNRTRRKKKATSAAQKLLIMIFLTALAVLVCIIWSTLRKAPPEIIDELNRNVSGVSELVPVTETTTTAVIETSASTGETTTSQETETTTAQATEGYTTEFTLDLPQDIYGQYTIRITYFDNGETVELPIVTVPDMQTADVILQRTDVSAYVSAEVFVKNNANGNEVSAGIINIDFPNDLCDRSGLDIYSAFLAVQ